MYGLQKQILVLAKITDSFLPESNFDALVENRYDKPISHDEPKGEATPYFQLGERSRVGPGASERASPIALARLFSPPGWRNELQVVTSRRVRQTVVFIREDTEGGQNVPDGRGGLYDSSQAVELAG